MDLDNFILEIEEIEDDELTALLQVIWLEKVKRDMRKFKDILEAHIRKSNNMLN